MTDHLTLPSQILLNEALQHWIGVQLSDDPKYITEHMYETESEGTCKYCIIFDNVVKSIQGLIIGDELSAEMAYYIRKAQEQLNTYK